MRAVQHLVNNLSARFQRLAKTLSSRFPRAARCLQSPPIARAVFVKDASGPIMPTKKLFKAHVSIVLCHYHMARTVVLGASFSMWASLGSPAAAGVAIAWVLALFVAVLSGLLPWFQNVIGNTTTFGIVLCSPWPYRIMLLNVSCPLLSATAILPLSALFMAVVTLSYSLGRLVLAHIGPSARGEQVWIDLPIPRGGCKWSDAIAGPTRTCVSWLQSTSIFSHGGGVLGQPQGYALAFTSTSYATLAGGLSCFWVLLAIASPASHVAWARARSLTSYKDATANDTTLPVEDVGKVTSGGERFDNHLALQVADVSDLLVSGQIAVLLDDDNTLTEEVGKNCSLFLLADKDHNKFCVVNK